MKNINVVKLSLKLLLFPLKVIFGIKRKRNQLKKPLVMVGLTPNNTINLFQSSPSMRTMSLFVKDYSKGRYS